MTRRERHRPQFHFSPTKHWINDPNGLIWFDGEYHLFYQTNPFGDQWGHMSWGHAVSPDLMHWQELPVAIAEDERVSIYSGSVVVDWHNSSGFGDGTQPPLVAIYTGCPRTPDAEGAYPQAQELACSRDRGRTWHKYGANPVLRTTHQDFRDPKVFWHAGTSRWVMVVVLPELRTAQFYGSPNLKQWALLSEFDAPMDGQGIWECPDLIPLPQPDVPDFCLLKVDTLQGHPAGGSGARLFFGRFDGSRFVAAGDNAPQWADCGTDFYAALSWSHLPESPPRQVWLAWMNNHTDAKHNPTRPWHGAMSLPRELSVRRTTSGWQLLQWPVATLDSLRSMSLELPAMTLANGEKDWPAQAQGFDARTLDLRICIQQLTSGRCGVLLRAGSGSHATEGIRVGYDAARGVVFVDGVHGKAEVAAPTSAPTAQAPLRLRVLLDWSSVEVFVGDGETVVTQQFFAHDDARGVRLFAHNGNADFACSQAWALSAARFS
jgi:fructan beta-fructosidase